MTRLVQSIRMERLSKMQTVGWLDNLDVIRDGEKLFSIPNFLMYCITKSGKVWSWKSGKFLRPALVNKRDYLQVSLYQNKKVCKRPIHRLVLETFVGPCPEGMECCHCDGDAQNNALKNLRWDSRSNNRQDAIQHGTHVDNRGERCGNSKLNMLQVRIIRRLLEFGSLTQREIGKTFGVDQTNIHYIKIKKSWSHI